MIVDSIVANTRLDERHHDDGGRQVHGVHARGRGRPEERHRDRRHCDDPLHPKLIAEFTEGVTAGVHSAFIYTAAEVRHARLPHERRHRRDPRDRHQRSGEAASRSACGKRRGRTRGRGAARHRHAGRAALRQLLERRAGDPRRRQRHQGRQSRRSRSWCRSTSTTSTRCTARSRARCGPGFIRGTHTAWRHRNYVFIADEVFGNAVGRARWSRVGRAAPYGRLQVIDVSDIEQPEVGGVVRAGIRRRAQRLGGG